MDYIDLKSMFLNNHDHFVDVNGFGKYYPVCEVFNSNEDNYKNIYSLNTTREYINIIKFCPYCGRKLKNNEEEY